MTSFPPSGRGPLRRVLALLPPGSVPVAAGLAVLGVASYGFLVVSARALGPEAYGSLSVLWAAVFLLPGIFLPWEQEVSRELTTRRVAGHGARSVVVRAGIAGLCVTVLIVVAAALAAPWIADTFFRGDSMLVVAFLVAVPGALSTNFVEGVLSGNARFGRYGLFLGAEATLRLFGCIALALSGVAVAGPYGLVLGLAPLVALLPTLWRATGLITPGPPMPWRPLLTALAGLVAGSMLSLLLVNFPPLLVEALGTEGEAEEVGRFTAALVLARVPLFVFQAVQAALLPQLTALASERQFDRFARLLAGLAGALAALALAATLFGWMIGPEVLTFVFGPEYRIAGSTIAMLAAGSGAYMVASALGQGVIALGGSRQVVLAWAAGIVVLLAVVSVGSGTIERVQTGYVAGAIVATAAMAVLARYRYRRGSRVISGDMLEAVHDLPLEP